MSQDDERFIPIDELDPADLFKYVLQERFKLYKDGPGFEKTSNNRIVRVFAEVVEIIKQTDDVISSLDVNANPEHARQFKIMTLLKDLMENSLSRTPVYKYLKAFLYEYSNHDANKLTLFKRYAVHEILPNSAENINLRNIKSNLSKNESVVKDLMENKLVKNIIDIVIEEEDLNDIREIEDLLIKKKFKIGVINKDEFDNKDIVGAGAKTEEVDAAYKEDYDENYNEKKRIIDADASLNPDQKKQKLEQLEIEMSNKAYALNQKVEAQKEETKKEKVIVSDVYAKGKDPKSAIPTELTVGPESIFSDEYLSVNVFSQLEYGLLEMAIAKKIGVDTDKSDERKAAVITQVVWAILNNKSVYLDDFKVQVNSKKYVYKNSKKQTNLLNFLKSQGRNVSEYKNLVLDFAYKVARIVIVYKDNIKIDGIKFEKDENKLAKIIAAKYLEDGNLNLIVTKTEEKSQFLDSLKFSSNFRRIFLRELQYYRRTVLKHTDITEENTLEFAKNLIIDSADEQNRKIFFEIYDQ
jgi:hypothetical protein